MHDELQTLNRENKGKAFIKHLDTEIYPELWNEGVPIAENGPFQLLINSDGTPFKTNKSEALGYRMINDENRKSCLYHT